VISIEILAMGISTDLASMSVNAFVGVLQMAVQVGDTIVVLRISGKMKAWESSLSLVASGSMFLVACMNWMAQVAGVIRRRVSAEVYLPGNAVVVVPESLS